MRARSRRRAVRRAPSEDLLDAWEPWHPRSAAVLSRARESDRRPWGMDRSVSDRLLQRPQDCLRAERLSCTSSPTRATNIPTTTTRIPHAPTRTITTINPINATHETTPRITRKVRHTVSTMCPVRASVTRRGGRPLRSWPSVVRQAAIRSLRRPPACASYGQEKRPCGHDVVVWSTGRVLELMLVVVIAAAGVGLVLDNELPLGLALVGAALMVAWWRLKLPPA